MLGLGDGVPGAMGILQPRGGAMGPFIVFRRGAYFFYFGPGGGVPGPILINKEGGTRPPQCVMALGLAVARPN